MCNCVNNCNCTSPITIPVGPNGDDGVDGVDGLFGGFSQKFVFNTSTAATPASTNIRLNNATPSSVTEIYISDANSDSVNVDSFLDEFSNSGTYGYIKLFKEFDVTKFWMGRITGVTDNGTDHTLTVVHINSNSTFAASDNIVVSFVANGALGTDGDDGFGYNATSSTSTNILDTTGTGGSFVISTNKAYTPGARIRFSATASPTVNYFEGIVTAYTPGTGSITVASIDVIKGSGTHSSWNVNLAGENGFNVYDSDWKVINDHNGSFGLASIGVANPSIRVIGKIVFINGIFIIPLAQNGSSTTLRTDANLYPTTYRADTRTFTGAGGFTTSSGGTLTSISSIVPTELRPTKTVPISTLGIAQRVVADTAGINTVSYTTVFNQVYLTTAGAIRISTYKDANDSAGTSIGSGEIYRLITKASSGEYVPQFNNALNPTGVYRTSFTGTGPGTDNRVATAHASATFAADVDGEDETKLGGYFFSIDISYPLAPSLTEKQIKTAFDSI